ncbi:hypothetical protein GRJ2_001277000 [Grus japonensis]|uniref:Uncharacterized protein n=1 Tax=Grus japonensis TaxID=30415 RepID=A0ABC9WSN8_GRUJA
MLASIRPLLARHIKNRQLHFPHDIHLSSVTIPRQCRLSYHKGCKYHVNCQALYMLTSLQGYKVVFIWSVDPCGSANCLYSIHERHPPQKHHRREMQRYLEY